MNDYKVINLTIDTVEPAIKVFVRAMNFPFDVEQSIIASTKMFFLHEKMIALGIEHNDVIIGFGALIPMKGYTAWIPYIGIEPSWQGKGIGKFLMENVLAMANQNNWETVELSASKAGLPLYQKFNFRIDFLVAIYEIKSIDTSFQGNPIDVLDIKPKESLPEWVLEFDKVNVGIDRSEIFPLHSHDHLILLSKKDHGYGLIYGKRIGPIIADSLELARDIIIAGFKLGADSLVLQNDPQKVDFLKKFMVLEMLPNTDGTKMTYGKSIAINKQNIFGLRSMAYG